MSLVPDTIIIGNHTQGLGILRSAAQANSRVFVLNDYHLSLTRFSRHLHQYHALPRHTLSHLEEDPVEKGLRDRLLALEVRPRSLLFGVNEDINRFIYRQRERLSEHFFIPPNDLGLISDKHRFNAFLPPALRLETQVFSREALQKAQPKTRYLLKGRRGNAFRRKTGQKALPLSGMTEARAEQLASELPPEELLIQEILENRLPVKSVCSFSIEGRAHVMFQYSKLRQHPNRYGTGTFLQSIWEASLRSLAESVLSALRYTGISEIEFIQDPESGQYKVIEMNPRPWKSIHFATQCGANLTAAYLNWLADGSVPEFRQGRHGHFWVDLATDLPQLVRERKGPDYPRGCFECVWQQSDPGPFVALCVLFPLLALKL